VRAGVLRADAHGGDDRGEEIVPQQAGMADGDGGVDDAMTKIY
jgi:hypothetical protein